MGRIETISQGKSLSEKLALIDLSTFKTAREIYGPEYGYFDLETNIIITSDLAVYRIENGNPVVYFLGRDGNPLADEKLYEEFCGQLKSKEPCIPSEKPLEHILNALERKPYIPLDIHKTEGEISIIDTNVRALFDQILLYPGIFAPHPWSSHRTYYQGREFDLIFQVFGKIPDNFPDYITVLSAKAVRDALENKEPGQILAVPGTICIASLGFYKSLGENTSYYKIIGQRKNTGD